MKRDKLVKSFVIGTFVSLYVLVSGISTIHSIDFFKLSNPDWMAITLAIAFEIGAAASLASLIIMDKMNKSLVWALFIAITAMQINGNLYYAFINMEDYQVWSELFNLSEWEDFDKKRLLATVSGAILPLVALGFIKSLVDYIKPEGEMKEEDVEEPGKQSDSEEDELFDWDPTLEDDELVGEYFEQKAQQRENYETDELLNQEHDDEELFDEDHALDLVMNTMVEDLEEEDLVDPFYMVEEKQKDAIDLVNSKKSNQDKMPKKDLDASFKFGKNLYDTMVKKANTDHLQVDSKPSKEQITQAYRNLGLVDKRK